MYEDLLQTILLLQLPQESLTKTYLAHYGRYLIYKNAKKKSLPCGDYTIQTDKPYPG